jgi:mRNA-degrading endonuclease RelE of RelBE toxin-antitoxin system
MKLWKMRFTPEASRQITRLHPDIKGQIKQALHEIRENPYSGKDLQQELSGFKSLGMRQHRIIYDVDEDLQSIQVYYAGRRRDVYEQVRRLLTQLENSTTNKK